MNLLVLLVVGMVGAPTGRELPAAAAQHRAMVAEQHPDGEAPAASSLPPSLRAGALANGVTLEWLGVRSPTAQRMSLVPSFVSGGAVVGLETRF